MVRRKYRSLAFQKTLTDLIKAADLMKQIHEQAKNMADHAKLEEYRRKWQKRGEKHGENKHPR